MATSKFEHDLLSLAECLERAGNTLSTLVQHMRPGMRVSERVVACAERVALMLLPAELGEAAPHEPPGLRRLSASMILSFVAAARERRALSSSDLFRAETLSKQLSDAADSIRLLAFGR